MSNQFGNGFYYPGNVPGMAQATEAGDFAGTLPGGPPPPPVIPKSRKGKTARVCFLGAVIITAAAILIFNLTGGTASNTVYQVPLGARPEGVYTPKDDITEDAPAIFPDENGPQISVSDSGENKSDETLIASEVYDKVSPSVVCITSYEPGMDYVLDAISEGSGIILTQDGYIATNSHVVEDSTETGVMVTLSDGSAYLGTIVGIDVKTDLAVIKIDAEGLTPAEFADSDKVSIGQQVFAIGNPGGIDFFNSLTKGTLSALNRMLSSGYVKYIQTDAAINPGNSGGALVDEHGRVIGMNTAKIVATGYESMGFAIPSNTVMEIINKLIKYGYVNDRGTLSVEGKSCTLYMSKANNIPQGMIITNILDGSPLKDTQAQKNDIITAINDVTVESSVELIDELKKYKPGDTVKLTLYRPGNDSNSKSYSFDVNVKLTEDTKAK